MKKSDVFLWAIVILVIGFVFWMITSGRLDTLSGSFIDGIWNSIENLVRPIFRR